MSDASREAYVVSAVRTPIGRFLGAFADVDAVELGVQATRAAIERAGASVEHVDELYYGNARQAGNGPNPARQVTIGAGLPEHVPAMTLNMACASGMAAIDLAAGAIRAGAADVVVAGGTESMSRVPFFVEGVRRGHKLGHTELVDAMYRDGFLCRICEQLMGETAETLATEYAIGRREQDEFAALSQERAGTAQAAGVFADEVVPVTVESRRGSIIVDTDEHLRPDTTVDKLAKLPPVFRKDGTVTAGNACGIVDGASSLLVASGAAVERHGYTPLVRLVATTKAGVDPARMGIGPVPAVRALLERTALGIEDIDLIELNEAFAAQVIACERDLGIDRQRLNVGGGAIALGHPIGATGARIVTTLIHAMRRRDVRRGVATLCVSGGLGMATLFEAA